MIGSNTSVHWRLRTNLAKLVNLFAALERQAVVNALSIAGDVYHSRQGGQVIDAAREIFEKRQDGLRLGRGQAKENAVLLRQLAARRFRQIASQLEHEIGPSSRQFTFHVDSEHNGGEQGYYLRHLIVQTARKLGYFANPASMPPG